MSEIRDAIAILRSADHRREADAVLALCGEVNGQRGQLSDALDLLRRVYSSDVLSDRSSVMFVHIAIDRDLLDEIEAMIADHKAAPAPSAVKESLTTGAHAAVPDDDEPEAIAKCLEDDAEILRDVDGYEAIPANMEKAAALIRRLAAQQQKDGGVE